MIYTKLNEKNVRYIRTKVDNNPVCLMLTKCNYCPFFKLMRNEDKKGICKVYYNLEDINLSNKIKDIYGYSFSENVYEVISDIDIPNWCGLEDKHENIKDLNIYFTFEENNNGCEFKVESSDVEKLDIIGDYILKYSKGYKLTKSSYNKNGYLTKESRDLFNSIISNKYKKICSCCGKEKDNVKRSEHIGMCSECWDKYKLNYKKYKLSYINNFRLKRKVDFSDTEFKLLNLSKKSIFH
jgi:hypothetical protein